jgi:hypothetical protein
MVLGLAFQETKQRGNGINGLCAVVGGFMPELL